MAAPEDTTNLLGAPDAQVSDVPAVLVAALSVVAAVLVGLGTFTAVEAGFAAVALSFVSGVVLFVGGLAVFEAGRRVGAGL